MFSATLDPDVSKIAEEFLKSPTKISIEPQAIGHTNIEQTLYYVDNQSHKINLLDHFLIFFALKIFLISGTKPISSISCRKIMLIKQLYLLRLKD